MEQFESDIYQEYDDVIPPDSLHDVKRRLEELSYTTDDSFLEEINVEKQRITKLKEQESSNGKRRLPTWNELESKLEEYEKLNYDLQLRVQCMMEYLHKTRPERVKQLLFESFKWERDRKVLEDNLAKANKDLEEFKGTPTQKQLIRNLTHEVDNLKTDLDIYKDQMVQQENEKEHMSKKFDSEIQFLRKTIEGLESQTQEAKARIEVELAQKTKAYEELESLRNQYSKDLKQWSSNAAQFQSSDAGNIKEMAVGYPLSLHNIQTQPISNHKGLAMAESNLGSQPISTKQTHDVKIQKRNELLETIFYLVESIDKKKGEDKSIVKIDINTDFERFATALAEKMYELIDHKTVYYQHLAQIKEECFLGIKLFLKAVEERLKDIYATDKLFACAGELKSKWQSLISLVQKDIEKVKKSFLQLEQVHNTKENNEPPHMENSKPPTQDNKLENQNTSHKELYQAMSRIHELETILDKKESSSRDELLAMKKKITQLNETIRNLERKCQTYEASNSREKELLRLETRNPPLEHSLKKLTELHDPDHRGLTLEISQKEITIDPIELEQERSKSQALERQLSANVREISRLKHKIKQRDIILRKITTQLELVNERKEDVEKVILRQVKNDLDIALGHGQKDSTDLP
ncbi:hypothetical protein K7432_009109 [Basidiobolus ranarum]|uniref:Uncharacterized protein n=1 Tax=Basidiobolus ranarum TaxID=34480 RepID=A0ABR2VXM3_9FUNG